MIKMMKDILLKLLCIKLTLDKIPVNLFNNLILKKIALNKKMIIINKAIIKIITNIIIMSQIRIFHNKIKIKKNKLINKIKISILNQINFIYSNFNKKILSS